MEFKDLVELVQDQPVFDSGFLLSGNVEPGYIRKQLSLWVNLKKIIQLKRGLYVLAPPFQKIRPHPFVIANRLQSPSYVSYQSALAHYGLIPERVFSTLSTTTKKPEKWELDLGTFQFHHVQLDWFCGYTLLPLAGQQSAFVALPEKALLDLIWLTPRGDSPAYLDELRLQNLEILDIPRMEELVAKSGKPKLVRFFSRFEQQFLKRRKETQTI